MTTETLKQNVEFSEPFVQVCIWPGTLVNGKIREFEAFMLEEFGTRVKYLEEIKTAPDIRGGFPVEDTGGRNDVFFAVHKDDLQKFAVPRLQMGIRWIEDVLTNERIRHNDCSLYPERVKDYRRW